MSGCASGCFSIWAQVHRVSSLIFKIPIFFQKLCKRQQHNTSFKSESYAQLCYYHKRYNQGHKILTARFKYHLIVRPVAFTALNIKIQSSRMCCHVANKRYQYLVSSILKMDAACSSKISVLSVDSTNILESRPKQPYLQITSLFTWSDCYVPFITKHRNNWHK